jgi:cytidyltransferase-like protein
LSNTPKKIFVSGCYDMLHSGHVAFFEEASQLGDLYVGIGSDKTVYELKGRKTINNEQERLYMVKAIRYVKDAWVNRGSGLLDFEQELKGLRPDIFFVNEDGYSPEKEKLCRELGIDLMVSKRIPHGDLPARSTTALRQECTIPYRIDLAGGWLDQPYVSKHHPGPVITISIEPDYEFNNRSGMATSTRKKAIELWETKIPAGNHEKLAKILFTYENPPGTEYVSGSQDSLGIVMPGANYLFYDKGDYWPKKIITKKQEDLLDWLEDHIRLLALTPRVSGYNVLENTNINREEAQKLAKAAEALWNAFLKKDKAAFGKAMTASFEAQTAMFPNMVTSEIIKQIEEIKPQVLGYKLSGAGGGGYIVMFTDKEMEKTMKVRVRRG